MTMLCKQYTTLSFIASRDSGNWPFSGEHISLVEFLMRSSLSLEHLDQGSSSEIYQAAPQRNKLAGEEVLVVDKTTA